MRLYQPLARFYENTVRPRLSGQPAPVDWSGRTVADLADDPEVEKRIIAGFRNLESRATAAELSHHLPVGLTAPMVAQLLTQFYEKGRIRIANPEQWEETRREFLDNGMPEDLFPQETPYTPNY